jgi:hypothetical protein
MTQHEDKKIRLWDTKDGRCFSISNSDIFKEISSKKTHWIPLFNLYGSRYFAYFGYGKEILILDLW